MARRPEGDPLRAVAYLRVSTADQALGLDAQRAAVRAYAERSGVEIVAWHEERRSGGLDLADRPGLLAALADLEARGAGALVVARRDRLARDVAVACIVEREAERMGARVITADGVGAGDDPSAQLMRAMLDAFAAFERALIRARTRAALATLRARGQRAGNVPMGYAVGPEGALVACPRERATLERVRALRAEGRSHREIVRVLAAEGHRTRRGGAYALRAVQTMLATAEENRHAA